MKRVQRTVSVLTALGCLLFLCGCGAKDAEAQTALCKTALAQVQSAAAFHTIETDYEQAEGDPTPTNVTECWYDGENSLEIMTFSSSGSELFTLIYDGQAYSKAVSKLLDADEAGYDWQKSEVPSTTQRYWQTLDMDDLTYLSSEEEDGDQVVTYQMSGEWMEIAEGISNAIDSVTAAFHLDAENSLNKIVVTISLSTEGEDGSQLEGKLIKTAEFASFDAGESEQAIEAQYQTIDFSTIS